MKLTLFIRRHLSWHMSRSIVAVLTFCLGMVAANVTINSGAQEIHNESPITTVSKPAAQFCQHFDFHWLELENERYSDKIRQIEIFMDEKAFSESNLKELFEYLSKSNPEPVGLIVVVHTDWSQFGIANPNCDGTGCGECNFDLPRHDHLQATYWRRPEGEYFRYSPKVNVDDSEFKEVVIKRK